MDNLEDHLDHSVDVSPLGKESSHPNPSEMEVPSKSADTPSERWPSGLPGVVRVLTDGGEHEHRVAGAESDAVVELKGGRVEHDHGCDLRVLHCLFPEQDLAVGRELDSLVDPDGDGRKTAEDFATVLATAWTRARQHPAIEQIYRNVDLEVQRRLSAGSVAGLQVDDAGLAELEDGACDDLRAARASLEQIQPGIDPSKDEHVERLLRQRRPVLNDEHDQLLPRYKHLEQLSGSGDAARHIWEYRKASNLYDQAATLGTVGLDGRLHVAWRAGYASRTGRVHMTGATTLSNINKSLRRCVVADDDHAFVVADYSAFELRVMAAIAREQVLLSELAVPGVDPHTTLAATLFAVSARNVTPAQRKVAKTLNFSVPFGESVYGIARHAQISRAQAGQYRTDYFRQYPTLYKTLKSVGRAEGAFLKLKSGRVLYIGDGDEKTLKRRRVAYTVQGTAADIAKLALINVAEALGEHGLGHVAIFLHDEIVAQVPEGQAQEAASIIKRIMETPPKWLPNVPLSVTPMVRKSWGVV